MNTHPPRSIMFQATTFLSSVFHGCFNIRILDFVMATIPEFLQFSNDTVLTVFGFLFFSKRSIIRDNVATLESVHVMEIFFTAGNKKRYA